MSQSENIKNVKKAVVSEKYAGHFRERDDHISFLCVPHPRRLVEPSMLVGRVVVIGDWKLLRKEETETESSYMYVRACMKTRPKRSEYPPHCLMKSSSEAPCHMLFADNRMFVLPIIIGG